MYISMTGYAGARVEREWGTLSLELSSVNHRYQEIYVRLPKELATWEPWFHQKLRGLYRRGKVQARAEILWASSSQVVAVNREVLSHYYRDLSSLREQLGSSKPLALTELLDLPGVFDTQERMKLTRDGEAEALLDGLLSDAVSAWESMRRTEGGHLRRAVEEHLQTLEDLMSRIAAAWPSAKDAAYAAMVERLKKALESAEAAAPEDARFAQEAVILADRWDVSEELARMESHIAKFRQTGEGPESVGRKLDFLVQEMNREVNTLNSKVADAGIRWLAVEAKAALERIREQIQNLE